MLEPEPLGGVGVLRLLGQGLLLVLLFDPVTRLLLGVACKLGLLLGLLLIGDQLDLVLEVVFLLILLLGRGALDGTQVVVVLLVLILLGLLLVLFLFD